jgi:hypothetical protein
MKNYPKRNWMIIGQIGQDMRILEVRLIQVAVKYPKLIQPVKALDLQQLLLSLLRVLVLVLAARPTSIRAVVELKLVSSHR